VLTSINVRVFLRSPEVPGFWPSIGAVSLNVTAKGSDITPSARTWPDLSLSRPPQMHKSNRFVICIRHNSFESSQAHNWALATPGAGRRVSVPIAYRDPHRPSLPGLQSCAWFDLLQSQGAGIWRLPGAPRSRTPRRGAQLSQIFSALTPDTNLGARRLSLDSACKAIFCRLSGPSQLPWSLCD
jgi:hypothetical protein